MRPETASPVRAAVCALRRYLALGCEDLNGHAMLSGDPLLSVLAAPLQIIPHERHGFRCRVACFADQQGMRSAHGLSSLFGKKCAMRKARSSNSAAGSNAPCRAAMTCAHGRAAVRSPSRRT